MGQIIPRAAVSTEPGANSNASRAIPPQLLLMLLKHALMTRGSVVKHVHRARPVVKHAFLGTRGPLEV